ncbi:phospholipase A and acyltransferase 1-like [Labrus bergylta]|uniref:phospholipase A and acyltransferase 1-like n=1 Tax=Labrus bergylta TaxID=56723 RepID=UPI0033138062
MSYEKQTDEVVATAKFGDLIEFSYPIGYSHWGVNDRDGYVIHFAVSDEGKLMNTIRTNLQRALPSGDLLLGVTKVCSMLIKDVTVPTGASIRINNRHDFDASSPEDMRRCLNALLGQDFSYHLLNLNCEHFATFVRYGKAVCNQIPFKAGECVEATKT